jgi:hypothetical protein
MMNACRNENAKRMMRVTRKESGVAGESGHTLVETVAALALLITVLIPASMAAAQLFTRDRAAERSEALRRAERVVEMALRDEEPESRVWSGEKGLWRVVQNVRRSKGLYLITVQVYRSARRTVPVARTEGRDEDDSRRANDTPWSEAEPLVTLRAARGAMRRGR